MISKFILFQEISKPSRYLKLAHLPLNDEQLDKYLENIEEKILDTLKNNIIPYTVKSINNMLKLVKQSNVLPTVTEKEDEIFQLAFLLVEKAIAMTITFSESAEKVFRKHPSSENCFKWIAT